MPRLLYLAISLVAGLRWGTIIVGGLVWLGSGFLLSLLLGLYYGHGPGGADAPHQVPTMGDARVFTLAALGAVLTFVHVFVARWHGAEHKVAAAYARDDPAWPDLVRTESRVHELCGGRFLLPLVVLLLAPIRTLTMWIAVEALLWIDKLYGIRRTPLLAQASTLLQKYITTAEPSNAEVETAIAAMRALIAAHDHEHELEKCARS
jgi:hypothetical protein